MSPYVRDFVVAVFMVMALTNCQMNTEIYGIHSSPGVEPPPSVGFDFTDLFNVGLSIKKMESDIVRVTNVGSSVPISISGHGGAQPWDISQVKIPDRYAFSLSAQDTSPVSLIFNPEGTKMFILGIATSSIYQYTLSSPFDFSTASYDFISFVVSLQDNDPYSFNFNSDGTKMFVVGNASNTIYQYTLASGFDLSTASYDTISLPVGGQDSIPEAVDFNGDGTKMFLLGVTSGSVHQYTLTTGYDLSTASYDFISFLVSGEDPVLESFVFNTDGTKMFVLGDTSDSIHQYTLTTAFDISTAGYDNIYFSVVAQDNQPYSLSFNSDGTKIFIIGNEHDSLYQYSLSIGFDLSTASHVVPSFSMNNQDSTPIDTHFNADGTKVFMLGSATNSIYQYTLTTGFVLSSASYDGISFSVIGQDNQPQSLKLNSDGTKMFILGAGTDSIYQYTLTTGFDLSTASYDTVSFSVAGEDVGPRALGFNTDGTKMYMTGIVTAAVHQYTLTTGFDLSTASYDTISFSAISQDPLLYAIRFNTDGTKMFLMGFAYKAIHQYTLITGFDVSTASYDTVAFPTSVQDTSPQSINFNANGTKMFMMGAERSTIHQYTLTTGFDIATASDISTTASYSVGSQSPFPNSLTFSTDGTKLFVIEDFSRTIYQYTLTTSFSIASANYDAVSFSVIGEDSTPRALRFNSNGTKMFVLGDNTDSVYQYTLTTGFDLSTASYDSVSFSIISEDNRPRSFEFNTDGTKMFILGDNTGSIFQYTLSTEFDLATASYDTVTFSTAAQDSVPKSLQFNSDGTKMFMLGDEKDSVHQYTLTTGFDLSTASSDSISFSVSAQDINPASISFSTDGAKMFMLGDNSDSIYEYEVGTGGYPEYRVCFDSQCNTVLYDWRRDGTGVVEDFDYIQIRTNTSYANLTASETIVTIGNEGAQISGDWIVQTEP